MKSILITVALAASTLAFRSPASAEPVQGQLAVSTAGLDLSTERGVRMLDLRILHAATALCGTPSPSDPRGRIKFDACRTEARTAAAAQRHRILAAARGQVELAAKQ
jgi:UrcA family protein